MNIKLARNIERVILYSGVDAYKELLLICKKGCYELSLYTPFLKVSEENKEKGDVVIKIGDKQIVLSEKFLAERNEVLDLKDNDSRLLKKCIYCKGRVVFNEKFNKNGKTKKFDYYYFYCPQCDRTMFNGSKKRKHNHSNIDKFKKFLEKTGYMMPGCKQNYCPAKSLNICMKVAGYASPKHPKYRFQCRLCNVRQSYDPSELKKPDERQRVKISQTAKRKRKAGNNQKAEGNKKNKRQEK